MHVSFWCTTTIGQRNVKQCEGRFPCCFSDYYFEGWAVEEQPWSAGSSRHKHIQLYSTNGVWLDERAVRACGLVAWWRRAPWCTNPKKTLWAKRSGRQSKQQRVASTDGRAEHGPDQCERSPTDRSQPKESFKKSKVWPRFPKKVGTHKH